MPIITAYICFFITASVNRITGILEYRIIERRIIVRALRELHISGILMITPDNLRFEDKGKFPSM